VTSPDLVVLVRCPHCHHRSILSERALAGFGVNPNAPIAAFVKRLRCSKCGSGSVMANRVARNEHGVRRRMHG
jgi:DNA-directed RNA polymerase subunit RPC12/RpoP